MKSGDRIGHLAIGELLGTGGMGDVFAAFDEKLQREVAVKVLREARWQRRARARLLREARALSQLQHPGICAIYDLLESGEGNVLVLERIRGRSLRRAIRDGLDRGEQLRVAEEIATALAAAHRKGIVHRDLKATNVMLTDEGTVKILDFGLAYPTDEGPASDEFDPDETASLLPRDAPPSLNTETYRTEAGEVVGTLPSMSPEQARGEQVSIASDMFAFGLLLQELFTGKPAYDADLPMLQLLRKVQEGEARPIQGVAKPIATLVTALQSIRPDERPTAAEALAAIRRVRDAPARRARAIALAVAGLMLVAGVVKYALDLRRERDAALAARAAAERARREGEEVVEFLVGLFKVADPNQARGREISAREVLDRGAEKIRVDLARQPLRRARMADAIGQTYVRLGLYERAEPLFLEALALRQAHLDPASTDIAASLHHLGTLRIFQGQDGKPDLRRAIAIFERAEAPSAEFGGALNDLGVAYARAGEIAAAAPWLARALAVRRQALGERDPAVAATLNNLAGLESYLGRNDRAIELLRQGLAIREAVLPADHPDLGANYEALATVYDDLGRVRDAEPLHRRALANWERALGREHPQVGLVLANLAGNQKTLGDLDEAEALYRRSLALREKALPPDHLDLAFSRSGLGCILHDRGRDDEAEPLLRRALAVQEVDLPPGDPARVATVRCIADLWQGTGRGAEAATLLATIPKPNPSPSDGAPAEAGGGKKP